MTKLLLLCIGLLLGLAVAELALRVLGLAPVTAVATVSAAEYARIPGILAPHQRLIDRHKPTLPFHVTTDSLGYRGADFPRRKQADELRVLLAGDSFTYGEYVDDDQTLPAQLERALRDGCPNARTINAGLVGATITDEIPMVERALPVAPDLVVVVFSENDVSDLAAPPLWTALARNRRARTRFPLSIVYPVVRRTALWNLGQRVAARLRARRSQATRAAGGDLRGRYRASFMELRDTLRQRHIPFAFVVYPFHSTVTGASADQVEWAVQMAERAGVPTINLLPPLQSSGLPTALYLPVDGHPNAVGYQIAAAYLAAHVRQANPARCRAATPR